MSATSSPTPQRAGLVSPAVLYNETKYEGLQNLVQLPRTLQRVEKVGFELMATTNRAQNAPKLAVSYPIWDESEHQGSFSTR
jgi:hypothetical protein